jgi:hypothetical protein
MPSTSKLVPIQNQIEKRLKLKLPSRITEGDDFDEI